MVLEFWILHCLSLMENSCFETATFRPIWFTFGPIGQFCEMGLWGFRDFCLRMRGVMELVGSRAIVGKLAGGFDLIPYF